jgi:hypothetical protein
VTITGYLNLRTGQILNAQGGYSLLGGRELTAGAPPAEALLLPLSDTPTLRLRVFDPWETNEAVILESGTVLTAALKPWNNHNGDPLAAITDDDWDKPATLTDNTQTDLTDDPGGFYTGTLSLAGDDLAALLPAGTDSLYCHLQIQTSLAGVVQSSQWIPVLIQSDVVRTTDGTVVTSSQPVPSGRLYYKNISSLIGGGSTALNGIPTVGKSKLLVDFVLSNVIKTAYLVAGTATQDLDNGVVLPLDYNASTNAQYWLLLD